MEEKINDILPTCEEMELEALIQVVELAHDYNLESNPVAEELYEKYIKDPRREEARKQFKRPAYSGTGIERKET